MKSLLVPTVVLLLVVLAGDLWAVTPPAKVAYVEGTVLIKKKGDDKPVPAELGQSLFYGDQVKTLSGKCQVNMTAAGILRMSPNTTVAFPAEGNHGDKISVVRMLQGKTMQNIENLWKDEVFEVRTPSLVAGVQDQPNTDAARVGYNAGGFIDGMINRTIERNTVPTDTPKTDVKPDPLHPGVEGKRKVTVFKKSTRVFTDSAVKDPHFEGSVDALLTIAGDSFTLEFPLANKVPNMKTFSEKWTGRINKQQQTLSVSGTVLETIIYESGGHVKGPGTFHGTLDENHLTGTMEKNGEWDGGYGEGPKPFRETMEWSIKDFVR